MNDEQWNGLNYFFDTLLFSGTILLLANAMEKETAVARI
jgi:hypothetical protein